MIDVVGNSRDYLCAKRARVRSKLRVAMLAGDGLLALELKIDLLDIRESLAMLDTWGE